MAAKQRRQPRVPPRAPSAPPSAPAPAPAARPPPMGVTPYGRPQGLANISKRKIEKQKKKKTYRVPYGRGRKVRGAAYDILAYRDLKKRDTFPRLSGQKLSTRVQP